MEEVKHIFKPEFINRIDEMIVFHALNEENIRQIAHIMIDAFVKRVREQMDIHLEIDSSVTAFVAKKGFDKDYGARPIRRALQTYVEDAMAEAVLDGKVSMGDSVKITLSGEKDKEKVQIQVLDEQ